MACLTALDDARGRLRNLDIACDCPFTWIVCTCSRCAGAREDERPHADELVPCPHVLAARDHATSLGQWAAWLWAMGLSEQEPASAFAEPPLPLAPQRKIRHQARAVDIYSFRETAGCHLYHERDYWRDEDVALPIRSEGRPRNGVGAVAGNLALPAEDVRATEVPEAYQDVQRRQDGETVRQRQRRERESRVNQLLLLRGGATGNFDARRALTALEVARLYSTPAAAPEGRAA